MKNSNFINHFNHRTHIDNGGSVAKFFKTLFRPTARFASPPGETVS